MDQEFDGIATDACRPRHRLASSTSLAAGPSSACCPVLSPRLRGDSTPLWAIEGGARTPAASVPRKRRRFVWVQQPAWPPACCPPACGGTDRHFGRSRGVRELPPHHSSHRRRCVSGDRGGCANSPRHLFLENGRRFVTKNGSNKKERAHRMVDPFFFLSDEASASSRPSWPEPS